jgi:hypothetical protein
LRDVSLLVDNNPVLVLAAFSGNCTAFTLTFGFECLRRVGSYTEIHDYLVQKNSTSALAPSTKNNFVLGPILLGTTPTLLLVLSFWQVLFALSAAALHLANASLSLANVAHDFTAAS